MANESLIHDALHLSDDDFGSKYGRDRTAKETVARNANETAGYKAAEEEAKKDSYFKRTYPEEWGKRIEEAKTAKAVDEARFNEVGEKAAAKRSGCSGLTDARCSSSRNWRRAALTTDAGMPASAATWMP